MADTTYRVVLDLAVQGDLGAKVGGLASHANAASSAMSSLGSLGASVGASIASHMATAIDKVERLGMAALKIGGAGVLAGAAYGVASLNNELEKSQISLATILTMNGQNATFEGGFARAGGLMKELRSDAAALPGEFKDLTGMFNAMAVPGFQAGMDPEKLRAFSSEAMAAAAALGVPFEQAGREMAMLMEGRAGSHNVFGMLLGGFGGDVAKAFNKQSAGDRVKELQGILDSPAIHGAIDRYKNSFDGVTSTLRDNLKRVAGMATQPLFERVKTDLAKVNDWFDANQGKVERFANVVGGKLVAAWDFVASKLSWVGAHIDGISAAIEKLVTGENIRKLGLGFAAMSLAKLGLNVGPGIIGTAFKAAGLGMQAMPAAAAGAEAPAAAVAAGGATAVSLAAGAAAATTLIMALTAAWGAMDVLSDSSNKYHAIAAQNASLIEQNIGSLTNTTHGMGKAAKEVVDWAGAFAINNIAGITMLLKGANNALGELGSVAGAAAQALAGPIGALYGLISAASAFTSAATPKKTGLVAGYNAVAKPGELDLPPDLPLEQRQTQKPKPAGGGGGGGGQHIQKVEIVVTSNQDPSRIARLTLAALQDIQRNPKTSQGARNWSAPNPGY